MPQKKNPDIAELARGKSGRLIGNLDGPARDAQGAAARVQPRPPGGQGAGLRLRRDARGAAARRSPAWSRRSTFDTDADGRARPAGLLARHRRRRLARAAGGVPFREAHEITGALVRVLRGARPRAGRADGRRLRRDLAAPHARRARGARRVEGSIASRDGRRRHRTGARRRAVRAARRIACAAPRRRPSCRGDAERGRGWARRPNGRDLRASTRSSWHRGCSARCSRTRLDGGPRRDPISKESRRTERRRGGPRPARVPRQDLSELR